MPKSIKKLIIMLLIAVLVSLSGNSAGAYLTAGKRLLAGSGEILSADNAGKLVIRQDTGTIELAVGLSALVKRDNWPAQFESLKPGDKVKIKYYVDSSGQHQAVEVKAAGPFLWGRIAFIDPDRDLITVKGVVTKTFEVRSQTVIMRDGSLTRLYDLLPGLMVKAEYENSRRPTLLRLKVQR